LIAFLNLVEDFRLDGIHSTAPVWLSDPVYALKLFWLQVHRLIIFSKYDLTIPVAIRHSYYLRFMDLIKK
jgi:hypothetical protein